MATANQIIKQAQAWVGKKESDGSHKEIIDVYNSHKPLARGYKVKYTDSWCATFVSAVAIKCNATDIIPTECGCGEMIALFQKLGVWVENENRTPNAGDIIFYDWGDNGVGDNKGWADHVGIVEKVAGSIITVIEGNYKDAVSRRTIGVNARNIRGYAVPKYEVEKSTNNSTSNSISVSLTQLKRGSTGKQVKTLQCILVGYGYEIGTDPIDGSFGGKTDAGVRQYQKNHNLTVDGVVGQQTWTSLLK